MGIETDVSELNRAVSKLVEALQAQIRLSGPQCRNGDSVANDQVVVREFLDDYFYGDQG